MEVDGERERLGLGPGLLMNDMASAKTKVEGLEARKNPHSFFPAAKHSDTHINSAEAKLVHLTLLFSI